MFLASLADGRFGSYAGPGEPFQQYVSSFSPCLILAAKYVCLVGYAPEKIQYGINRYVNETRRLYSVMETQLAKSSSGFLVGDRLTIADVAAWGWVASHGKI